MARAMFSMPSHPSSQSLLSDGSILANFRSKQLIGPNEMVTHARLLAIAEQKLREKIADGNQKAHFQLGQLFFEEKDYISARITFIAAFEKHRDLQSYYQLGVIYFDGLGAESDQEKAVKIMHEIVECKSPNSQFVFYPAAFNLGVAYYYGLGVKKSYTEAEKWWLLAADDGNPRASVPAQTYLGYFYCQENKLDLKKAFFWHTEACGNGSLESQGVLGVMYLLGLGITQSWSSAFECLKEASDRGNIYAQGNLAYYYYQRKLYCSAIDISLSVTKHENLEGQAFTTNCSIDFVYKGVAMAYFIYGRCLHKGLGIKEDAVTALKCYSTAFLYDSDLCAKFTYMSNRNEL